MAILSRLNELIHRLSKDNWSGWGVFDSGERTATVSSSKQICRYAASDINTFLSIHYKCSGCPALAPGIGESGLPLQLPTRVVLLHSISGIRKATVGTSNIDISRRVHSGTGDVRDARIVEQVALIESAMTHFPQSASGSIVFYGGEITA